MSRVRIAAGIVAVIVGVSIATANPSPAPAPTPAPDDCRVTGRSDGSVPPEIMAENYRIAKQICEDLAQRNR